MNDIKASGLLRVLIPVLVLVAIVAIWFIKNRDDEGTTPQTADSRTTADSSLPAGEASMGGQDGQSGSLEATSIDLDSWRASGLPLIIDFGADWCYYCREMKPTLVKLESEMRGKALIRYVNVDKVPGAGDFPVTSIPTQVLYGSDGAPYMPGKGIDTTFYRTNNDKVGQITYHSGFLSESQLLEILKDMGVD